jgi:hypothetical protein
VDSFPSTSLQQDRPSLSVLDTLVRLHESIILFRSLHVDILITVSAYLIIDDYCTAVQSVQSVFNLH